MLYAEGGDVFPRLHKSSLSRRTIRCKMSEDWSTRGRRREPHRPGSWHGVVLLCGEVHLPKSINWMPRRYFFRRSRVNGIRLRKQSSPEHRG